MRPVQFAFAAVAVFVLLGSCSKDTTSPNPAVTSIHVTPGVDSVGTLGRTVTFAAQPVDAGGAPVSATVVWRSSNPAVATVDSVTGLATALTNGTTIISAHVGNVSGQATMAVSQVVAHVVISPPSAGFTAVGDTQRLTAVAKDSSGAIVQGVPFLWFSSDGNVAIVDTAGLVRSKGPGQGFITAAGRGVPASAVITVTQTPVHLKFSITPPDSIPVDRPFPRAIQVEVRDLNGSLATGARIPVTISVGAQSTILAQPGAVNGTTTVDAVGGIATFTGLTMSGPMGYYVLAATAPGMTPDSSAYFLVQPGVLATLSVIANGITTAGAPFPVQVEGFDKYGNVATLANDTVVLTGASQFNGALDRPTLAVMDTGWATFDSVIVDGPGAFTLTARAGAVTGSALTNASVTFSGLVSVGVYTACATDAAGRAFCWGLGSTGAIGGGRLRSSAVPRLVVRNLLFTQLSPGYLHSCGLTVSGAAFCWGDNSSGQGGHGTVTFLFDSVPKIVTGGHQFAKLTVGFEYSCGVTTAHELYCWGDDSRGGLGSGKAVGGHTATPTLVSGGLQWQDVSAGTSVSESTCGLTTAGVAYCWGGNELGQLGTNSTKDDSVPTPVVGGVTFTTIARGGDQACALAAADSTAYCWGSGGLGRNATQQDSVAAPTDSAFRLVALSSGSDKTCGLGTFSQTICWQTGGLPGTREPHVDGRWSVSQVIASGAVSDCRSSGGLLSCMGDNTYGELGDGTRTSSSQAFVSVFTTPPPAFAPRKR